MLRYVLLEHDTRSGSAADADPGVHWDLLIQRPDAESLWTWRLDRDPRPEGCAQTERIADHRPLYLEYEGPISGGRGRVRRVAAGELRVTEATVGRLRFAAVGGLAGAWEIEAPGAAGRLARIPDSDAVNS
ncbi:MAG: hypothetical protein IPM64_06595 [Phycisphaerales bacterium]|nr:hypothetical protein [Phycisphaerales bacterium]